MELAVRQRRSRFYRQPTGALTFIGPRDLAIFALLARYRYLPSTYILGFVGGNPIRLAQRLGQLFHEGYLDRPPRQWEAVNARYRPVVYELGAKARKILAEHVIAINGIGAQSRSFAHELMVCLAHASLELSSWQYPDLDFLDWAALRDRAPQAFADPGAPGPLTALRPDGLPFALRYSSASGTRRALYFPGFEIDRHTEPLRPTDLERSSLARKILGYRELVATEAYRSLYGFPNLMVPIVTVNARHLENMIALVLALTNGRGASYLLFKTVRDFGAEKQRFDLDLALLTAPWQRAGYPSLDLLTELGCSRRRAPPTG